MMDMQSSNVYACNSFSNAEEPNEQWRCEPHANLDFTLVRRMSKKRGSSFDAFFRDSFRGALFVGVVFVFKFDVVCCFPPLYAYDATTRILAMFRFYMYIFVQMNNSAMPFACEGQGQLIKVPLEGKLVFSPSPTDMVLVNGVELTPESSLQALRTALTFHSLSTSGSKSKCFTRLLNHQKQQELEIIHAATEHYQSELARVPKAVDLKVPPSEEEQQLHNLSHLPYAP